MDTNQITQFDFHGATVRVLANEQSETWFIAKDICDVLGIDTNHIREGLDDDEITNLRNTEVWNQSGRAPLIISEAGFYKLVLRSRKPVAKEFQRWVTHEVLPAIRRDGAYVAAAGEEDDETLMARALQAAQRAIARRDKKLHDAQKQLEAQAPKVLFADAVAASDGTCLVGELAKMLTQAGYTIGQNRLFAKLRDEGFLGKTGSNRNVPLQQYVEQGLFRIKETAVTHADGHVTLNRTPKVTGKGQNYFLHRYTQTLKEGSK
ncbi:phage antirepressor KilAC domain-containing protein [Bifidobacterium choerinum]|uniref:Phage antirepressor Ant n=1 Tax=Bifidobacterium choerinum TaxID=35760 RepID=A0A2D3D3B3_9BIFI|nr:phage antirepressor KilAC domain-containing protein [Bifidobacterium choerinum]ATU19597.1 phage antirepressor Ant [Bifidobacterium choerinum]